MLRIAEFARSRGVETVPHAWKSGIIKAASLHVNAVLPDALFQEYCIADTPINQSLTQRAPADRRRRLPRPCRPSPGLGVTLDEDVWRSYRVD